MSDPIPTVPGENPAPAANTAASVPPAAAPAKANSAAEETVDFLKFLLKLGLFVFILRSFIIAPFNIPSESMQPRLLIGDYLLVAKWPYGYSRHSLPFSIPLIPDRIFASQPERGDVAVFKAPPTARDDYIKRVIGLPGDVVEMRGGQLFLNGNPVARQRIADFVTPVTEGMIAAAAANGSRYPCAAPQFEETGPDGRVCRYRRYIETLPGGRSYPIIDVSDGTPGDDVPAVIVPQGHMFMMGDNRDRSADSRFAATEGGAIGIVPQEYLVGKALVSVFSTDGSATWLLPWTWVTAARWERIGEGF